MVNDNEQWDYTDAQLGLTPTSKDLPEFATPFPGQLMPITLAGVGEPTPVRTRCGGLHGYERNVPRYIAPAANAAVVT